MRIRDRLSRAVRGLMMLVLAGAAAGCAGNGDQTEASRDDGIERRTVAVTGDDDVTLSYLKSGPDAARTVIFIHGTPGSAETWMEMIRANQGRYRILSPDRPGFGATVPSHAVTSLQTQAAALAPLLAANEAGKPILVGHSLGGPIAAAVSVRFPDKVGGLILAAASMDPSLERTHPLQYVGEIWPVAWLLPRWARNSNRELLALKGELETLSGQLGDILAPVMIVHGTEDELVPYDNVQFMQAAFHHRQAVEFITLTSGDHFLPWNAKDVLWRAIARLDRKLRAAEERPVQTRPAH